MPSPVEETFLGVRVEVIRFHSGTVLSIEGPVTASTSDVIRGSAPVATWEGAAEAPLLSPQAALQWYEDEAEHHEAYRAYLGCRPTGGPPLAPWGWPRETAEGDNVTQELLELVQAGDEAGFRALAGCVMPAGEVDECWCGARARLGLQS